MSGLKLCDFESKHFTWLQKDKSPSMVAFGGKSVFEKGFFLYYPVLLLSHRIYRLIVPLSHGKN